MAAISGEPILPKPSHLSKARAARGAGRLQIAPSCSLLHTPVDLDQETKLDGELKSWLAFAKQKLHEVTTLALAADHGKAVAGEVFRASDAAAQTRAQSVRTNDPEVAKRMATISEADLERRSAFAPRRAKQQSQLQLPPFPTTTIGSFPQTEEVRKARAAHKGGKLDDEAYTAFLQSETEKAIRIQEDLGIAVLVHGDFERNDMVEYFGEQLSGFAFTQNGWVQSYGSRYVRPPVIYHGVLKSFYRPWRLRYPFTALPERPRHGRAHRLGEAPSCGRPDLD